MIGSFSLRKLFQKDIKTICLTIGGFYVAFGALSLLIVKVQTMTIFNFDPKPDDNFLNMLNILHNIWIVFMPLMILLGIGYLLFGLLYFRIKVNRFQVNLVLSILSLIWVIAYAVSSLKYLYGFFAEMATDFAPFKYIGYVIAGFGFIAVLAVFTVPQYIIGKRIKKEKDSNPIYNDN